MVSGDFYVRRRPSAGDRPQERAETLDGSMQVLKISVHGRWADVGCTGCVDFAMGRVARRATRFAARRVAR